MLLEELIEAFRVLPGVGRKSAQRMAYHVLERGREGGKRLATVLAEAVERIGHCARWRDCSEGGVCAVCAGGWRERRRLCVVETAADRLPIDTATVHPRVYFALQGPPSPLDGVGPRELGLKTLRTRLAAGEVSEMITATSATADGEATAHYLAQLAHQHGVRPSRLAQG